MQAVEVRAFPDGEMIIKEGDRGDELFIVLTGQVKVTRGPATLTHLGPGEHVGEMALIRSVPRSANVIAEGPAELIAIRRADFFEILRKEHELAVKMLWQFLGVLADRLDVTSSELRTARAELSAEDITAAVADAAETDISEEIFPEMDSGTHPAAPRNEAK
jgi:CRP-like cAMP-binding protein